MNPEDAKELAAEYMTEWRLYDWKFQFDTAESRFGCCHQRLKLITLSLKLTLMNDVKDVKDVLLHEIAHALVGPGHGHDEVWKDQCRKVGARPERLYDSSVVTTIPKPWKGHCPGCNRIVAERRVVYKEARRFSCTRCSGGKWDPRFLLTWKKVDENGTVVEEKPPILMPGDDLRMVDAAMTERRGERTTERP